MQKTEEHFGSKCFAEGVREARFTFKLVQRGLLPQYTMLTQFITSQHG